MSRQTEFITELIKYDVQIVIATGEKKYQYFRNAFSFPVVKVWRPWIECDSNGILFEETKKKYIEDKRDFYLEQLQFFIEVEKEFNGKLDFVITDYEPLCAQYAYASDIPLICMHEQSKYLYLENENVFSEKENYDSSIKLMHYFFPYADKRVAPVFFPLSPNNKWNFEGIPLMAKKIKRGSTIRRKLVVYLSPYPDEKDKGERLLNVLQQFNDYDTVVYSNKNEYYQNKVCNAGRFEYKEYSDGFKEDLSDCVAVFSSAGFQLISEAISSIIPVCVFPLSTYDQLYCAHFVGKIGAGVYMREISIDEVNTFMSLLPQYKEAEKHYMEEYQKSNWKKVLFDILENEYGIKR